MIDTPPHHHTHRKGQNMKRKAIVYGYARISTMKQRIERQIDNIKQAYPDAIIITEAYTGTKIDRPAFSKLLKQVQAGDTLVFDEVSRMSRNAAEGFILYRNLYEMGVNLVFIKEPHINSSVYRERTQRRIEDLTTSTGSAATDKLMQAIIDALNAYSMDIVQEQIQIAFDTAQAEVDFLHKRTSEGVRKAQERYRQEEILGLEHEKGKVGRAAGSSAGDGFKEYAKAKAAKEIIKKHNRDFGGALTDAETIKLAGCARGSYYRYKRQLRAEIEA